MKGNEAIGLAGGPFLRIRGYVPVILGLMLLLVAHAAAARTSRNFNLDPDGYALRQYDPVGYFTMGKALRGKTGLTIKYKGAKYAFSSEENRKLFLQNPEKFLPQYGGYCAFGLVYGSKSDIDPEIWEIVDGRLFFLINPGTMSLWSRKKESNIRTADKAWESINGKN